MTYNVKYYSNFFNFTLFLNLNDYEILDIKELSSYLKIAEKTAYRLVSEKKIPGFKIGGSWRFRKSEIDRWIVEQEKKHNE